MTTDDRLALKLQLKQKKKNPSMRFFIARKTGGNARGVGANRSVILGSFDGKSWFQAVKLWGENNEERAREFIKELN